MAKNKQLQSNAVLEKNGSVVLGMPPSYHSITDPNGRVYSKLWGELDKKGSKITNTKLYPVNIEVGKPELISIADRHILKKDKNKTLATYRFGPLDSGEYSKVLKALLDIASVAESDILNKTTVLFKSDNITKSNLVKNSLNPTFTILASEETSINETASNTIGNSKMSNILDKGSNLVREINFTTGSSDITQAVKGLTNSIGSFFGNTGQSVANKVNSSIDKLIGKAEPYLGESVLKLILAGSKVILPKIWQESSFSKSYNLAFRFFTPYGTPESLILNIIMPYLYILSFSLPRQDSINTYNYPFIIRVSSPGAFSVPMGIVTSISVKKGGSYDIWSKNGTFRSLDVTLTINDLTEVIPVPNDTNIAMNSIEMNSYIRSLIGADVVKGKKDLKRIQNKLSTLSEGEKNLARIQNKLFTLSGSNVLPEKVNNTSILDEIGRDISAVSSYVGKKITNLYKNDIAPTVEKIGSTVKEAVSGFANYIKESASNIFNPDNETDSNSPKVQVVNNIHIYIYNKLNEYNKNIDNNINDGMAEGEIVNQVKQENNNLSDSIQNKITEEKEKLKPNLSNIEANNLEKNVSYLNDYTNKSINNITNDLKIELNKSKKSQSIVFKNNKKITIDKKDSLLHNKFLLIDSLNPDKINKFKDYNYNTSSYYSNKKDIYTKEDKTISVGTGDNKKVFKKDNVNYKVIKNNKNNIINNDLDKRSIIDLKYRSTTIIDNKKNKYDNIYLTNKKVNKTDKYEVNEKLSKKPIYSLTKYYINDKVSNVLEYRQYIKDNNLEKYFVDISEKLYKAGKHYIKEKF